MSVSNEGDQVPFVPGVTTVLEYRRNWDSILRDKVRSGKMTKDLADMVRKGMPQALRSFVDQGVLVESVTPAKTGGTYDVPELEFPVEGWDNYHLPELFSQMNIEYQRVCSSKRMLPMFQKDGILILSCL